MLSWLIILAAFLLGLLAQRSSLAGRGRDLLWIVNFWGVLPALVFSTFLTYSFDRTLLIAVVAVVGSSWTLLLLSYLYARVVSKERDEVGALTLGAAFGNTGFVGYPLAQLVFGHTGLNLAVVYDQLAFGVPMTSVTPILARLHGRRPGVETLLARLRLILLNPPLWALIAALSLRAGGVQIGAVHDLETICAKLIGPLGFLMLGLSLPLEAIEHAGDEVARAAGAIAIRQGAAPLLLLGLALTIGAHVPATFYLVAASPTAFHVLVLARLYDMRPALLRLLIVASTVPVVLGAAIASRFV
ncbi:MAG: AEC family transporter [Gaiellaceae bacterium]